jgi:hypothetical protein
MSKVTKQIATFEVETSFNLAGRGIVAVGKFIEGMAKLGAKTNVVVNGKSTTVTIIGIEEGKPDDAGIKKFGLLLRFHNDEYEMVVEQERLQEQEIVLENPLT